MSNDLRNIDSRSKEILLNRYVKMPLFSGYKILFLYCKLRSLQREIIAVNQDSLGKQGQRVKKV
mgnify:CR=1 FL=1